MSASEIMTELPNLTLPKRQRILERIMELESEADILEAHRRMADETFQMLDAMEADDAHNATRCR